MNLKEEEQNQHDEEEVYTPSYFPYSSPSLSSQPSSSPFISSPTNLSTFPRKTKSLREIYEDSRKFLNEDLVNFTLFADVNSIFFKIL